MSKVVRNCPFCANSVKGKDKPLTFTNIPRFNKNDILIGFSTSCDICLACGPVKPTSTEASFAWGLIDFEEKA